uniref:TIR domain-containing protein n=1 Tax=Timema genevievae TaxID=629358 RepID=A0A7R9PGQ6_TIMGE|nr:unnamed protein product [Timema genevievae]
MTGRSRFKSRSGAMMENDTRRNLTSLTITCDMLERARDYAPFISFPFYLHTRWTFVTKNPRNSLEESSILLRNEADLHQNGDDSLPQTNFNVSEDVLTRNDERLILCLGLSHTRLSKITLESPWKNMTTRYVDSFWLFLLLGAQRMLWESDFDDNVAVGFIEIDETCWRNNRTPYRDSSPELPVIGSLVYYESGALDHVAIEAGFISGSSSCISKVQVLEDVLNPGRQNGRYSQEYWKEWKYINQELLGAHETKMVLDFDPEFNISTPVYIVPFLNGTGFHDLRVTGNHWDHMEHWLDDLPELTRLDLTANEILNRRNAKYNGPLLTKLPCGRPVQSVIMLAYTHKNIPTPSKGGPADFTPPAIEAPPTTKKKSSNLTQPVSGNFRSCPNLKHLNLANNRLVDIPPGIGDLHDLISLDLTGNKFNLDEEPEIENFTNVLRRLDNLKWLNLSHTSLNNVGVLRPLLGVGGLKLLGLDISFCGLTYLEAEDGQYIFKEQAILQYLNLAGNRILVLPPRAMYELQNLKLLNLSYMHFNESLGLEFEPNHILEILDLSHNNFTSPDVMVASGCVRHLDLSNNIITSWNSSDTFIHDSYQSCFTEMLRDASMPSSAVLTKHPFVKHVNLSFNFINSLSFNMRSSLERLESVDLGGNHFECEHCQFPELQNWLQTVQDNTSTLKMFNEGSRHQLKCYSPSEKLGAPISKMKRRSNMNLDCVAGNFKYDAFVCYSGSDRTWVMSQLVPHLEQGPGKYRLCLHERDFILGSFISTNIVSSLQNSKFTIVILTNNFVTSQWCQWELEMANHRLFEDDSDFLILLELERLDRTKVPRHLNYLMATRTYLEWPQHNVEKKQDSMWRRLELALGTSVLNKEVDTSKFVEIPLRSTEKMETNFSIKAQHKDS